METTKHDPEEAKRVIQEALGDCPEERARILMAHELEADLKSVGLRRFNISYALGHVWGELYDPARREPPPDDLLEKAEVLEDQLTALDEQMANLRVQLPKTYNNAVGAGPGGDPWARVINRVPDFPALGLVPDEDVNAMELNLEAYIIHLKEKYPDFAKDHARTLERRLEVYAEASKGWTPEVRRSFVDAVAGPVPDLPPVTQPVTADRPDVVLKG